MKITVFSQAFYVISYPFYRFLCLFQVFRWYLFMEFSLGFHTEFSRRIFMAYSVSSWQTLWKYLGLSFKFMWLHFTFSLVFHTGVLRGSFTMVFLWQRLWKYARLSSECSRQIHAALSQKCLLRPHYFLEQLFLSLFNVIGLSFYSNNNHWKRQMKQSTCKTTIPKPSEKYSMHVILNLKWSVIGLP